MAMRSASDSRRVYPRAGSLVLTHGGTYYGPNARTGESKIDSSKEVKVEELTAGSKGKKRLTVTQKQKGELIQETWTEKEVIFTPRKGKES